MRNQGLVVLSACSHAGIVNVVQDVTALFEPTQLFSVMGGLRPDRRASSGLGTRYAVSTDSELRGSSQDTVLGGERFTRLRECSVTP